MMSAYLLKKNSLKKQQGWSTLQIGLFVGVAGFFLLFGFKTVPQYAENRYVVSGLKDLAQSDGSRLAEMTDSEIKGKMDKFYMINNVRSEGPTKNIKIDRKSENVIITIDYETRVPFFYNIDLVFSFKNHLDSTRPAMCCSPLPETKSRVE
jgi:Domain of unknown function (DUF4845)